MYWRKSYRLGKRQKGVAQIALEILRIKKFPARLERQLLTAEELAKFPFSATSNALESETRFHPMDKRF